MGGVLLDGIIYINVVLSIAKESEVISGVTKYFLNIYNCGVLIKKKEMANETAVNTAMTTIKTAIPNGFVDFDTILA